MRRDATRREFLGTVLAGAAAAGTWPTRAARAAGPAQRPPNILVIMSDEHDPGVTGCYGNDTVQTPHIDSLAADGVTFECAYTNSPLCVPARLAFTAGKYVSRIGAWSNNCWLPSDDYPSLPRLMNAVGYESLLCGKQHYDRTRRYGFTDLGGSMNNSYKTGKGGRRKADDERVNVKGAQSRFQDFHVGDTSRIVEHDQRVTATVTEFLANRRRTDKPFFLFAGYIAPHFPLIVPEPYWLRYKDEVPMPNLPPGSVERQPLNYQHLRRGFGLVDVDPAIVKIGRELYYGLTNWVDDEIGKLLAALAKSDVADNTVVIYTTDHGENKGDHALWWKNCMYEQAARAPLIIRYPERWKGGQRVSGACSHVDLVQTIAELGGAETPDDWNGDSLCALMDDPGSAWKDFAVSEYYAHNIASGFAMFRAGQYKYVYHTTMDEEHGPERELYDMQADPGEFDNLASAPEHAGRVEEMHRALSAELGRGPEDCEQLCRRDYATGYGRPPKPQKKAQGK
jgi:choline-sulfatase